MELAALERQKRRCHIFFSGPFKLSGNDCMHTILDEFEFQSDWTEELKLP